MAACILPLLWLLATSGPHGVIGDGELFLSSSSTTSPARSDVVPADDTNFTFDCNPYSGQRYLTFGNGNGITSTQCTASWDLHEIQLWDENGIRITGLSAFTATGHSADKSQYAADKAIDGRSATFFAGDHDVGMSCDCWDSSKKDGQTITIDMGSTKKVSKIMLQQGGAGNEWAISKIRIHCGQDGRNLQANPLQALISFGETDIECNDAGCDVTRLSPGYYHTCDSAMLPTTSFCLLFAILLGPALAQPI